MNELRELAGGKSVVSFHFDRQMTHSCQSRRSSLCRR